MPKYPYFGIFYISIEILEKIIYVNLHIVNIKILKLLYFYQMKDDLRKADLSKADFRSNLRAELDYLGLTVKELSAKTGIAKGTLDCYLGVRASMPPADIAAKIANALGVTVEYLVTGQEIKKQDKLLNHNIRSIIEILLKLSEKDIETILGLSKILKNQSGKK